MADNKVEIKVTADAAQAVSGLGAVEKGLQGAGASAQQLTGNAASAGKGMAQMGQGAEVANTGLGKTRQGVQSISEQLDLAKNRVVAFIGAQLGLSAVKSVAETADAYNNLQARIKLATGEGAAFTTAFAGVADIAQRTSSNLEQTGNLFAKLTETGKSAGLSTQAAITQALGLTETINQAVQLSGGSAESAKASITQLIQGLQGGVLRGDEFNSVMEQSPRLAKALADGLGVTTGELRKMAEAGSLSSDTVIAALKGQAQALKGEFATLPATVGRALENLTTSWTLYLGEADKASGASSKAAGAIELLAKNLSTVGGLLMDAGQAAAALTAIRLAQYFAGVSAAAAQATVAVVASTAATTANTVAHQANAAVAAREALAFKALAADVAAQAAALGGNTAATVANSAAKNASGAAATVASVGVGKFAALLSGLKLFSLIGIVTNFHDIGTAIGEGIAKLAGYKDMSGELARQEKLNAAIAADNLALRERGQALLQAAINKQFELSKAATASIAEFDKLTKEGTSAAEAVAKIGKDFDLTSVPGIANAAAVLDKLASDGKLSATQFQTAWSNALKGSDLAVFETQARAAFAGSAREAERLAQVLDATAREAIKRTGLDFGLISGGMGAASRSAINDTEAIVKGLDGLKKQGVDTAQALTASIGKSINTADGQKAIEAVKQQIESLRQVLGDKLTDGLLDQAAAKAKELTAALNGVKPGIQDVAEAMKLLGITSDESLRKTAKTSQEAYELMRASGTASARELSAAFAKSAADAIAANNGIAPSWVQAQAGAKGFELAVDSAGKTILRAMGDGGSAVDALGQKVRESTVDFEKQAAALDAINARYGQSKADRDGKYSRPGEGPNNSVLTKDDMKAVDNTGLDSLLQKRQAGSLSQSDLTTAEGVFKAAAANLDVFQKNANVFSLEGAKSINDNYNASRALLDQIRGLAAPKVATPAPTTATNNTYLVKIDLGNGRTSNVNVASANDAQTLISALQSAKSAAGL